MTSPDTADPRSGGFNLDDEIEPITLHGLGRYGIDEGTIIAEPSDEQLAAFRKALYLATRPSAKPVDVDNLSEDEIAEALLTRDWSAGSRKETDAFAQLCGATPPTDDQGNRRPRPVRPDDPEKPARDKFATDDAHTKAVKRWETEWRKHETAVAKYEADLSAWEDKWTGGQPTRQQLAALPPRARNKLYGYLMGLFMDPFAGEDTSDTSG